MKILFIYTRELPQSPVKPLVDFEAIQFGISCISSYLKKHGHETRLLILTRESKFLVINQFIDEFSPHLICFTAVSSEYLFIEKIGKYIKKLYPDKYLLIGGVHVSLVPEETMLKTFNALCIGEGEEPTLELVSLLENGRTPSGIANLWINNNGSIEKNPTRSFISELDSFPNADRKMWMEWIDFERSKKRPSLLLGRGCPFLCSYCCNHSLMKLAEGSYVRFRSPINIISEIEEIIDLFPMVQEIYFEVESLGNKSNWGVELCNKLKEYNTSRNQPLTFGVNLRITPDMKRLEELFDALEKSNFRFVNIGLESGSERVRREILRRNYSNEDVIKTVTLAKKHNLEVVFYNLIGLPTETIYDFNETIEMNQLCLPNGNYLSIFYPYPGTDIYKMCADKSLIPSNILSTEKERIKAVLDFPEFSRKQIQKAFIWFNYYVYHGHKPDERLFSEIIFSYRKIYRGLNTILLPLVIARDLMSPSLKLFPKLKESSILKYIPSIFFKLLKSRLINTL